MRSQTLLHLQEMADRMIFEFGATYHIRESGETFLAIAKLISGDGVGEIAQEGTDNNAAEIHAYRLLISHSCQLKEGQNVYRDGDDPDAENYRCGHVGDQPAGGIVIQKFAVISHLPRAKKSDS